MGRDKALISLGGVPLIERVLHRVQGLGSEVLITTNDQDSYAYLGVPLVADRRPGAGALPGLLTALEAASYDRVLIVGCDMPFLARPLLERLADLAPRADAVLPRDGGQYEPLLAAYSKACISTIQSALAAGERRMISFLSEVDLLTIDEGALDQLDPQRLSFFNVNTPEQLARAERLLAQQSA